MKTAICLLLMCLPFVSYSQGSSSSVSTEVLARVTLGRQGNDCRGRGICSFQTNTNRAQSNASLSFKDGDLTFVFYKADISASEEVILVGTSFLNSPNGTTPFFVVEDSIYLDATTKQHLNITQSNAALPQGTYQVYSDVDTYTLTIKLE